MSESVQSGHGLTTEQRIGLLKEISGRTCRCGRSKGAGHSFCKPCYAALPEEKRNALYQHFGEGYEEAYAVACAALDGGK